MMRFRRGDTLIEVLIAFAILSLVMSTAFSGSLAGFKSAQAAQNRTMGTFLAQYQSEALKAYRDSLEWEKPASGPNISFLDGDTINGDTEIKAMRNFTNDFCMEKVEPNGAVAYWRIQTNTSTCKSIGSNLTPGLKLVSMNIKSTNRTADAYTYIVKVTWKPANSNVNEQSVSTIILTKK